MSSSVLTTARMAMSPMECCRPSSSELSGPCPNVGTFSPNEAVAENGANVGWGAGRLGGAALAGVGILAITRTVVAAVESLIGVLPIDAPRDGRPQVLLLWISSTLSSRAYV